MYPTYPESPREAAEMIIAAMEAAERARLQLRQEIADLVLAGVYDAPPIREVWEEGRRPEQLYLHLIFPQNPNGDGYMSPNQKKKLYVGAHPIRVKAAREQANRTHRVQQLQSDLRALDAAIREAGGGLRAAVSRASDLQRTAERMTKKTL